MKRHKSAIKRNRQNNNKNLINSARRSALKTAIKKVEVAIESKDVSQASSLLVTVISLLDKAANKEIIHKNKASRKISRLTRKVNGLTAATASA